AVLILRRDHVPDSVIFVVAITHRRGVDTRQPNLLAAPFVAGDRFTYKAIKVRIQLPIPIKHIWTHDHEAIIDLASACGLTMDDLPKRNTPPQIVFYSVEHRQ